MSRSCGAQVLTEACRRLGVPAAVWWAPARRLECAAEGRLGLNSLLEVRDAARSAGLDAAGYRVSEPAALRRLLTGGPVVVAAARGLHFFLVTGAVGPRFRLIDGTLRNRELLFPSETLPSLWSGHVLALVRPGGVRRSAVSNLPRLRDTDLRAILGGCNVGPTGGVGINGATIGGAPSGPRPRAPTTEEPVQLGTGNLTESVQDIVVPTRGLPMQFARFYNAQATSELWEWLPEPGGSWIVEDGEYSGQGGRVLRRTGPTLDGRVEMDVRTVQPGPDPWDVAWINLRYMASPSFGAAEQGYFFFIARDGALTLGKWNAGAPQVLVSKPSALSPLLPHRVAFHVYGRRLLVVVDGSRQIDFTDGAAPLTPGRCALEAHHCHAHFDNVVGTRDPSTAPFTFSFDDSDSSLGPGWMGWTHTYSMRVRSYPDHVTLIREDNSREFFAPKSGGGYYSVPRDYHDTLTQEAGGFRLRRADGRSYLFDPSGRLTAIEDRNANQISVEYALVGGVPRVSRVVEPAGRALLMAYDPAGRLVSVTDPAGAAVRYEYDLSGHLVGSENRLGDAQRFAYDPVTHNMIGFTDRESNTYRFAYTHDDRVSMQTDPLGNEVRFDYLGATTGVSNSRGEAYLYALGADGLLTSTTDPRGETERFERDRHANLLLHRDRNGAVTRYSYDARGNMVLRVDAAGRRRSWTYEAAFNRVLSETDERKLTARYTYDASGNMLSLTDTGGFTRRFTYDPHGQLASATDHRGSVTQFGRSEQGDVTSITDPGGFTLTASYDPLGRRLHAGDSLGALEQSTYDAEGRVLSVTNAAGETTSNTWSPGGHLTDSVNALGQHTRRTYDCYGNILSEEDGNGAVTRFTYDTANQLQLGRVAVIAITDPRGHSTGFEYDAAGRRTRRHDALGADTRFEFDPGGRMTSRLDAAGGTTRYEWDRLDRMTRTVFSDGTEARWEYDPLGRLLKATDAGGVTGLQLDARGLPVQRSFPDGSRIKASYDADGRLESVGYVAGVDTWFVRYSYDERGLLVGVSARDGKTFTLGYDARRRRVRLVYPNGVVGQYGYDGEGRTRSYEYAGSGGGIARAQWTFDGGGRPASAAFEAHTLRGDREFSYDAAGALTGEAGHLDGAPYTRAFRFDSAGNRVQDAADGVETDAVFDELNRRAADTGGAFRFNGLGCRLDSHAPGPVQSFGYDVRGRLSAAAGAHAVGYTYDAVGERTAVDIDGVRTSYYAFGGAAAYEKTGIELTTCVFLPGSGEVLARFRGQTAVYLHCDALGSVVAASDCLGRALSGFCYEPFGALRAASGGMPELAGYAGHRFDPAGGILMRNRYYDPATGVFLSPDPLGTAGGLNLYQYASNDPIAQRDAWGLEPAPVPDPRPQTRGQLRNAPRPAPLPHRLGETAKESAAVDAENAAIAEANAALDSAIENGGDGTTFSITDNGDVIWHEPPPSEEGLLLSDAFGSACSPACVSPRDLSD
jgi:RHS repeat-associated protein